MNDGRTTPVASQNDDETLRRFLLGRLSAEDSARIEDRFFTDDEAFERLLDVEDELIEAYVGGELPADDRAALERRFGATAAGGQSVRLAEALARAVRDVIEITPPATQRRRQSSHAMTLALAATLMLAAAASVAFLLLLRQSRLEAGRWESERTRLLEEQKTLQRTVDSDRAEVERLATEAVRQGAGNQTERTVADSRVVAVSLTSGVFRSDTAPRVRLEPGVSTVLLELSLEKRHSFDRLRVVIESAEGQRIWQQEISSTRRSAPTNSVAVAAPASLLATSDYIVRLEQPDGDSAKTLGVYTLQVDRRE